jgi:hypothetical protein
MSNTTQATPHQSKPIPVPHPRFLARFEAVEEARYADLYERLMARGWDPHSWEDFRDESPEAADDLLEELETHRIWDLIRKPPIDHWLGNPPIFGVSQK